MLWSRRIVLVFVVALVLRFLLGFSVIHTQCGSVHGNHIVGGRTGLAHLLVVHRWQSGQFHLLEYVGRGLIFI